MKLPAQLPIAYRWLGDLKVLPKTIEFALDLFGVHEVVGQGSNRTILSWCDELNAAGVKIEGYSDDDIPWCGLFAAIVVFRRRDNKNEVVKEPLWARNWAKYGTKAACACLGDILVFERGSSGHVGFYVAEDTDYYHVLGGNQSDQVGITRVAKSRCIAIRRPNYQVVPASVRPYHVASSGAISHDEA